jgi:hypothetical protein
LLLGEKEEPRFIMIINNKKYPYYFNSQNLALILFDGVMSKHGIYPAGNARFVVNECGQNV